MPPSRDLAPGLVPRPWHLDRRPPSALVNRSARGSSSTPRWPATDFRSPPWQGGAPMDGFNAGDVGGHPPCGFVRLRPVPAGIACGVCAGCAKSERTGGRLRLARQHCSIHRSTYGATRRGSGPLLRTRREGSICCRPAVMPRHSQRLSTPTTGVQERARPVPASRIALEVVREEER
jgi:hypothetical protein